MSPHKFSYPPDGQYQLQGVASTSNNIYEPQILDIDGSPLLAISKRGKMSDISFRVGDETFSLLIKLV